MYAVFFIRGLPAWLEPSRRVKALRVFPKVLPRPGLPGDEVHIPVQTQLSSADSRLGWYSPILISM